MPSVVDYSKTPQGSRIARSGKLVRPTINLCQVLQSGVRQRGNFIALIKDPESGEILAEIVLWSPQPGEAVELSVEWQKLADDPTSSRA